MSSPSQPRPSEAVVRRDGEVTGPIRLPPKDRQRFIEAFNRLYGAAGLSIAPSLAPTDPFPATPPSDDPADRHR